MGRAMREPLVNRMPFVQRAVGLCTVFVGTNGVLAGSAGNNASCGTITSGVDGLLQNNLALALPTVLTISMRTSYFAPALSCTGTLASVAGYAVTGRSGNRGFLQRLAVEPRLQGRGLGRLLVLDALGWLGRRRVERVVVNTQLDNGRALELYEGLGFRREPVGLSVLAVGLDG